MEIALLIIGGLVALVVGGDLLVRGASQLALIWGIPSVVIGLTVVAFGTSTPELAVSIDAAFADKANIAIANVVGSNIFNTFFILGVSALIAPLLIHSQMIRREVPIMIAASLVVFGMSLLGNHINRFEGILLAFGIVGYTFWLVREAIAKKPENKEIEKEFEAEIKPSSRFGLPLSILFVVGGLGVVMLGADWLVDGAVKLATSFGVSDTVIGLTIVAAGTSLPEVVASVMATIKGERDIAVGNVIGSNIYNLLAIVGVAGAVAPSGLAVESNLLYIDMPIMIFASLLCLPFFKTGQELSRKEGAFFLFLYVAYTFFLIQTRAGS